MQDASEMDVAERARLLLEADVEVLERDLLKSIGEEVAKARHHAGLTQKQLATRIGCNRVTVANIERGAWSPSLTMLAKIAATTYGDLRVTIAQ